MQKGVGADEAFGGQVGRDPRVMQMIKARRKRAGVTVSVGTGGKRHDRDLKGLPSAPIQGLAK